MLNVECSTLNLGSSLKIRINPVQAVYQCSNHDVDIEENYRWKKQRSSIAFTPEQPEHPSSSIFAWTHLALRVSQCLMMAGGPLVYGQSGIQQFCDAPGGRECWSRCLVRRFGIIVEVMTQASTWPVILMKQVQQKISGCP